MPLKSISLGVAARRQIKKKVAALIRDGIIAQIEPQPGNYRLSFYMSIQIVPKKAASSFSFGEPEGVRVFIGSSGKLVAAVDFLYVDGELEFSHIHQGKMIARLARHLQQLIRGYAGQERVYHAELISFLYINADYIMVRSGNNRVFYRALPGNITAISLPVLKKEIKLALSEQPMPHEL